MWLRCKENGMNLIENLEIPFIVLIASLLVIYKGNLPVTGRFIPQRASGAERVIWLCSMMASSCSWWRHQMETFSALLALCAGNSPVTGEFPSQRPVTRSFDVFFDLHLNKRLSKQSWAWWLKTPSYSLWRHCNASIISSYRRPRQSSYVTPAEIISSTQHGGGTTPLAGTWPSWQLGHRTASLPRETRPWKFFPIWNSPLMDVTSSWALMQWVYHQHSRLLL